MLGGEDAFPADLAEWADNDLDGINNNADIDIDDDQMPDDREIVYGLDPPDGRDALRDSDGLDNLTKY
ncbi:MAG: hypothetical protein GXP14_17370 [Gammaproteobacteria bacterium]|nr:hypothetical protein [Gammaproteobacteria bacterium]